MMQFLQPAATLFIGLALFVYGLVHSLLHRPSFVSFQAAAQAMPDAVAVLVFALGIAAIVVGIVLLISGIKGLRSRTREINRTYGARHLPSGRNEYEDDWDRGHPAYH